MNVHEVVNKLIGPINPVGETYTDNDRFINLNNMIELVNCLLYDIHQVAQIRDNGEYSIQMASKRAKAFLKELTETDN